jgi:hypothetical protein
MVCQCRFPRLLGRKSETSSRRLELVADFLETSPRQARDSLPRVCLEEVAVVEFGLHGWEQLHIRVSTTGVRNNLSHNVAPSLPAWSSKRERCCCMSAASSPERRARGQRVGRASRSPCAEVSISSSANGRRISAAGHRFAIP